MRLKHYLIRYRIYTLDFSNKVKNRLGIFKVNLSYRFNRFIIWWKSFKYQNIVFLIVGFTVGTLSIDREYSLYNKKIKYYMKNNVDNNDLCYISLEMANNLLQSIILQKNINESDVTALIENQEIVKRSMLDYYNSDKQRSMRYKRGYNGN